MTAVMVDSEPSNLGGKTNTALELASKKPSTTTLGEAEKNVLVGTIFQKPSNSDSHLFSSFEKPSTGLFGGSAKAPVNLQDAVAPSVAPLLSQPDISSLEKATIQAINTSTSKTNAAKIKLSTNLETTLSENNVILLTAEEITAVSRQTSTTSGALDASLSVNPISSAGLGLSSSNSSSKSGILRDIELEPLQAPRSSATSTLLGLSDLSNKAYGLEDAAQHPVASKISNNASRGTKSGSGGPVSGSAGTFGLSYRNRTRSQPPSSPSNGFSSAMAGYFNDVTRISGISGHYTGFQAPKIASGAGSASHFGSSSGKVGTLGGSQAGSEPPNNISNNTSSNSGDLSSRTSTLAKPSENPFTRSQTPIAPSKNTQPVKSVHFTGDRNPHVLGPNWNDGPLPSPPLMYKAPFPGTTSTTTTTTTQPVSQNHFVAESSYSNGPGCTFAIPSPVTTEGDAKTPTNNERNLQVSPPLSPFSSITIAAITSPKEGEGLVQHGIIIAGFNGVGKTYFTSTSLANTLPDRYVGYQFQELDVAGFTYLQDGSINPEFPGNYVAAIKDLVSQRPEDNTTLVLLISGRAELGPFLKAKYLRYHSVYPELRLKQEYLARCQVMGWPQHLVDAFDRNWWRYIGGCETHAQTQPHIVLRARQFLSDVVDRVLFTELLGRIGGAGNRRVEKAGRSRRGWGDIRVSSRSDEVLVKIPGFHGIRIKADGEDVYSIVDNIWMFTVIACFFVLTAGVGSAFLVMTYIMLFYVGYDV